jgi:hypothetical protein
MAYYTLGCPGTPRQGPTAYILDARSHKDERETQATFIRFLLQVTIQYYSSLTRNTFERHVGKSAREKDSPGNMASWQSW